ncbi:hypothetical protein JVT61DRAFT_2768 [Boletus reticuloceps]|uniref:Uncharacterized protein n=1 Tax=Boletus reticuloceps TaxID=495285 RepID=A0A8I2YPY7_9AGAM|nr:hypothetical protein JVT61DRAFT_2768 [Boletus reticuloceps]
MCHSPDPTNSPHSWYYSSTGPAPPTPVVVNTVPDYFGSRPTPPPSPLRVPATPTIDDYAPCPSTPYCVPSCMQGEEMQWSNTLTSHSTPPEYRNTSELDQSTVFEDPLTVLASNDSGDQAQYDVAPRVSYCPTYDPERYASSPIRRIFERIILDSKGLETQRVNAWPGDLPIRPNTCRIPVADHESFDDHLFSIGTIRDLQHDLRVRWRSVNLEPILPVIVRCTISSNPAVCADVKMDGIWDAIYQRGMDSNFWPICSSTVVDAQSDAMHRPQDIVASKFAVNIFLEVPHPTGSIPRCEYLGAYLLEVEGVLTISGTAHSLHDSLHLPYVRFSYYAWDESMIRLANELCSPYIVEPSPGIAQNPAGHDNGDSDAFRHWLSLISDTDQYCDVGQDTPSTPRADSQTEPEPDYESFVN